MSVSSDINFVFLRNGVFIYDATVKLLFIWSWQSSEYWCFGRADNAPSTLSRKVLRMVLISSHFFCPFTFEFRLSAGNFGPSQGKLKNFIIALISTGGVYMVALRLVRLMTTGKKRPYRFALKHFLMNAIYWAANLLSRLVIF